MAPVKVPMPTQMTMILGPSRAALGISGWVLAFEVYSGFCERVFTFNHVGDGILAIVSYYDVGLKG